MFYDPYQQIWMTYEYDPYVAVRPFVAPVIPSVPSPVIPSPVIHPPLIPNFPIPQFPQRTTPPEPEQGTPSPGWNGMGPYNPNYPPLNPWYMG
ncbi:hypothetical protein [Marininema halotolerans]|uniref:Uncharacterized protein n=1 Tax=Marininema halotolerans TaxID=1155944 RepID=A0A1I6UFF7_9BACL|nr:hypothetical protein [Marininema halotolerans]SFT00047.1 hypothetical protein SAMN05444972_11617 [Marininema halotolerans]